MKSEVLKMKVKLLTVFLFTAVFVSYANADVDSDIKNLQLEKEKLNGEITKLNKQIAVTDSMLKADDKRLKSLQERYKADVSRRKSEIETLNGKIKKVAAQLNEERGKQAQAKNRSENVKSKRKALLEALAVISKQLEQQISQTLPWERDARLDRARSLTRDIESGNASVEEAFSRLKALIAEETKFGDEVAFVNSPLTRKNGEMINAQILRIGNQWMVYGDENGTVYGSLVRRISTENGENQITYEWNEDLDLEERAAVKFALDVKQAKKPPQMVTLPVSLSIVGEGK